MSLKKDSTDDRSAIARGYAWSIRITTLALEVALLSFAGHWVDSFLGTGPLFVLLGSFVGLTIFFVHLVSLVHRGDTGNE